METFQGFYENLLAKVGDPLLMKIFTAFVTLNVNWIYWICFDKELNLIHCDDVAAGRYGTCPQDDSYIVYPQSPDKGNLKV